MQTGIKPIEMFQLAQDHTTASAAFKCQQRLAVSAQQQVTTSDKIQTFCTYPFIFVSLDCLQM